MTAAAHAVDMIRSGRPPALAIYVAAREHGQSTAQVSSELRARGRRRVLRVPTRVWWED